MPRHLNLRQIEAFKAIIENGTMRQSAEVLNISQPAVSKMIAHLEFDTGLQLFDRVKGRLAPTENGVQLYEEINRIFAGVRQVENAVEAIRRQEQGRIAIGVMPGLSGSFIQRVTTSFLGARAKVFCSVEPLSSQLIIERLIARKLDVGLVGGGYDNPYVTSEPLMEHSLVCIMFPGHPLTKKKVVKPKDLEGVSFVSLHADTYIGNRLAGMFEHYGVQPDIALVSSGALTISQFVAAGLGVSLVHPLMVSGLEDKIAVRRFEPEILYNFQLCRSADSKNARMIDLFAKEATTVAAQISTSMFGD